MRRRILAELSFPCLPSVACAASAFLGGVGKPDVSPGVLAHILGAAASSSWVDLVEQPVPLSSVPPPALAPGPPPFLAPSVLISCLALPGAVALHPQREAVAILGRQLSPERKEGGRGKSIAAKCGGHEPCRGCGMGCLERSGAFCSLLLWSWERSLEALDRVWGRLPPRRGSRWQCRVVRIRVASWRGQAQPRGSVGVCCPRAPNGLSSLVAPKQHWYLA